MKNVLIFPENFVNYMGKTIVLQHLLAEAVCQKSELTFDLLGTAQEIIIFHFSFAYLFVCYIFQNPESRPVLDVAILAPLPAWKRVQKLMAVISLPDLMFSLAPAAFKKVGV